jgi:L-ascorbate metabolism protein UlaG (beta-lactamase superfamily)
LDICQEASPSISNRLRTSTDNPELVASISYAGHATVLIEVGGARLVTDPLLRDRLFVVIRRHGGLGADDLLPLDGVLISHVHHDHLDLKSLRELGGDLPLIVPRGAGEFLSRRGFGNLTELGSGETIEIAGASVTAVEARHEGGRVMSSARSEAVGYVVDGEAGIYFAGDTELFPGMADFGPGLDLALLPVWGWGPTLGPGHLNPEQAAEAAALLHPRIAVPVHWGTLAPVGGRWLWPWLFSAPGQRFEEAVGLTAPEVGVRVLRPGERLELSAEEETPTAGSPDRDLENDQSRTE